MRTKQRDNAEWGYRLPTPGYHTVCIQEGIDVITNENSGKQSLMIPAAIDEGGSEDGIRVTVFCPYKDENGNFNEFGEQKAADVLNAVNLYNKFEEKFPGDISLFDTEPLEAIKLKLPGTRCQMKVEISTDGKFANVMAVSPEDTGTPGNKPATSTASATKKGSAPKPDTTKKNLEW